MNKKAVTLYSIAGILTLGIGVAAGVLVGQNVFKQKVDYSQFDTNEIEVDYSAKYEDFKKTDSKKYFTDFTPIELANITFLKLDDTENWVARKYATVLAAGVEQTINAINIKKGDIYFEENISQSTLVKAAHRFYQEGEGIEYYKGKYVNPTKADYPDSGHKEYTLEGFEDEWGGTKDCMCIYIVSEATVIKNQLIDNSDGTKTISADLDPTLSVIHYVKQMKMTGGLSQEPIFHSVHLDFKVDDQLRLLEIDIEECYDVHMIIDAKNSIGKVNQVFKYEEREIPEVNTGLDYDS